MYIERVCVCVCERERERKRDSVCVYARTRARVRIYIEKGYIVQEFAGLTPQTLTLSHTHIYDSQVLFIFVPGLGGVAVQIQCSPWTTNC